MKLTASERRVVSLELRDLLGEAWTVPRAKYNVRYWEARRLTYDEAAVRALPLIAAQRQEFDPATVEQFGWPYRVLRIQNNRSIRVDRRRKNGTWFIAETVEAFHGPRWLDRYVEWAQALALEEGSWISELP